LKVIALPGDLGACAYYRVFAPLAALERAGLAQVTRPPEARGGADKPHVFVRPSQLEGHDIAIFSRQPDEHVGQLIKIAQGMGVQVVFDIDDDVYTISPNSPAYASFGTDWRKIGAFIQYKPAVVNGIEQQKGQMGGPSVSELMVDAAQRMADEAKERFQGLVQNMRRADLLTVSTERLREVYSRLRNDVAVLPNQLEQRDWEAAVEEPYLRDPEETWIGWAGSKTHWPDLAEVVKPMEEVLRRTPRARLVLVGFPEAVALFEERVRRQVVAFDWMALDEYRRVVAAFDVALAPAAAIPFNEAKSDIRVLEAAVCGVPVVASATTYGDTVREAGCGFVAKTPQKWLRYLTRLVKSAELRAEMGAAGRRYVLEQRTYDANAWRWADVYDQLLEV
jgi:glycosyltransferase involved in cell wall biosynthesis